MNKHRVFFPKGNVARAVSIENKLPHINSMYSDSIVKICEDKLIDTYSEREPLGKVYIDKELRNYLIPSSQRSASKTAKVITRGSRLPICEKAKAVRGFIWWTNINGGHEARVDIDLSAAFFDKDWNYISHCSYTSLRLNGFKTYQSGDITNGGSCDGDGVSEFIDIDIKSAASGGARYFVFQINSYTGQNFSDMPNARFGWMERESVNSGEIFEPKTVAMSMDITSKSKIAIPVIFDLVRKEFIWCDVNIGIDSTYYHYGGNNVESNLNGMRATCYAMTNMNKPSIYDLVELNAKARGFIVDDRNDADIIFSNDTTIPVEKIETTDEYGNKVLTEKKKENVKIVTAFDIDYIMGQLL